MNWWLYTRGDILPEYEIEEKSKAKSVNGTSDSLAEYGIMSIHLDYDYGNNAIPDIVDYEVTRVQGSFYIFE